MNKLEALRLIRWLLHKLHRKDTLEVAIKLYDEYVERK